MTRFVQYTGMIPSPKEREGPATVFPTSQFGYCEGHQKVLSQESGHPRTSNDAIYIHDALIPQMLE